MNSPRLTDPAKAATMTAMVGADTVGNERLQRRRLALFPVVGAVALSAGLAGCISVQAPDKPIVIELNINIRQEVIYRLAEDAGNTIKDNPDIF